MEEIKRCNRCILPLSLPSVKINEQGTCNHCRNYENILLNTEAGKESRKEEFEQIIYKAKKLNRQYDCLVPLSGGKDSTYVLYLCSKVYKMKCLSITFDNGFLSDYAINNIKNALKATDSDHIFYSINRNNLLELYKIFLKKTGNLCSPCMRGINMVSNKFMDIYNIPLKINGGGARIDYLSMFPEIFESGELNFFKKVIENEPIKNNVQSLMAHPFPWKTIYLRSRQLLRIKTLFNKINLHDYFQISNDEILKTITNEMGWSKPSGEFEHIDCMLHEIPFYIHTKKFPELTRTTLYNSGLIRLGDISREEALKQDILERSNPRKPKNIDYFLKEINLSEDEFESYIRDWRKLGIYNNNYFTNSIKNYLAKKGNN